MSNRGFRRTSAFTIYGFQRRVNIRRNLRAGGRRIVGYASACALAGKSQGGDMDALILPALLVVIVAFYVGVWRAWLGRKEGRALQIDANEPEDIGG